MSRALGMIETKGLIGSISALDAMVKSSDVSLVKQEKVSAALVTVFVEGDVSAVSAAVEAGKIEAQKVGELIDYHVIPHPDDMVRNFLNVKENKPNTTEQTKEVTTKKAPAAKVEVKKPTTSTRKRTNTSKEKSTRSVAEQKSNTAKEDKEEK